MNPMVVLILSTLLVVAIFLLYHNRGLLILFILLPASEFLGFVDPMAFAVAGAFDIHALVFFIILSTCIVSVPQWSDVKQGILVTPMLIIFTLWLYGIILPMASGHSSWFFALKGSKEFLTVFSYFSVFLFIRKKREIDTAWQVIIALAIYYAILEIIAQVAGPALLSKLVYFYRKEIIFWKVYLQFWPVMLVAFFHYYYEYALGIRRAFIPIGITSLGILLTFYRSYVLATAISVPTLMLLGRLGLRGTLVQGAVLCGVIGLSIIGIALTTGGNSASMKFFADHFVVSGISEFKSQSGGSLAGREVFAKERREIFNKRPYTGYGFIDKDSSFGRASQKSIKGDMLGFIDKGELDTAIKFGIFGAALLYGTAAYFIFLLVQVIRARLDRKLTVRALCAASLILVYLLVQPVHAALTHSFALLPLGIILGLVERERLLCLQTQRKAAAEKHREKLTNEQN